VPGHLDAHRRQELVRRAQEEPVQEDNGQGHPHAARPAQVHKRLERTGGETRATGQSQRRVRRLNAQFEHMREATEAPRRVQGLLASNNSVSVPGDAAAAQQRVLWQQQHLRRQWQQQHAWRAEPELQNTQPVPARTRLHQLLRG